MSFFNTQIVATYDNSSFDDSNDDDVNSIHALMLVSNDNSSMFNGSIVATWFE